VGISRLGAGPIGRSGLAENPEKQNHLKINVRIQKNT
jgi:hypothetical protein